MGNLLKKITNYKTQITNKSQITMSEITNKKLIKSFCGGVQMLHGGSFFKKSPPWPPEVK
jgi:hypothetical protein